MDMLFLLEKGFGVLYLVCLVFILFLYVSGSRVGSKKSYFSTDSKWGQDEPLQRVKEIIFTTQWQSAGSALLLTVMIAGACTAVMLILAVLGSSDAGYMMCSEKDKYCQTYQFSQTTNIVSWSVVGLLVTVALFFYAKHKLTLHLCNVRRLAWSKGYESGCHLTKNTLSKKPVYLALHGYMEKRLPAGKTYAALAHLSLNENGDVEHAIRPFLRVVDKSPDMFGAQKWVLVGDGEEGVVINGVFCHREKLNSEQN